jgi:hypothetical protein
VKAQQPQPSPRAWPDLREIERAIEQRRAEAQQRKAVMSMRAEDARDRLFGGNPHVGQ